MTLPPEVLERLRRAAATRREITRLVYVERPFKPPTGKPPIEHTLVIVLDDLPTEPPPAGFAHEHVALLSAALPGELCMSYVIPSPVGLAGATRDGVVVYERGVAS